MHPQQHELQSHLGCSLSGRALKSTAPVLPLIFSSLFHFSLPFITSTSFLSTYFVPDKLKYASEFVIVLAVQTCFFFFFPISDKILNSVYAPVFSQMWQIILIVILIGEGMPGRLLKCISQCACEGVCRENWPVELTRKEAFWTRAAPSTSLHWVEQKLERGRKPISACSLSTMFSRAWLQTGCLLWW